jgi:integrase
MNLLEAKFVAGVKPREKAFTERDGGGLFLVVEPSGKKWWKYRGVFAGKETSFSFGSFPDVALAQARKQRDKVNSSIANGINPAAMRKAEKATKTGEGSFEAVAREWHDKFSKVEWSVSHSKNILIRLEKHIFPWVGGRPINQIYPLEMREAFTRIEKTGHLETLHRTISNCGQIFRFAIATGRADIDPTYKMTEGFAKPIKKHFSTILDPVEVGKMLRSFEEYHGDLPVKTALLLSPLVMLRPGELRLAEWVELDFEKGEWRIPIRRMKRTRRDKEAFPNEIHLVPLSKQAIRLFEELKPLTGDGDLVFPGMRGRGRAITDCTLTRAIRSMGYDKETLHIHGFRAMCRTLIKENILNNGAKIDNDVIERQLSHATDNPLGKAYDRTIFMPERIWMMQAWADYLDELKANR